MVHIFVYCMFDDVEILLDLVYGGCCEVEDELCGITPLGEPVTFGVSIVPYIVCENKDYMMRIYGLGGYQSRFYKWWC